MDSLKKKSVAELKALVNRLRTEYDLFKLKKPLQQNEEMINKFLLIKAELKNRKQSLPAKNTSLDIDARGFTEIAKIKAIPAIPAIPTSHTFKDDDLASVEPSGDVDGDPITFEKIEPYFKSFIASSPAVWIVGGVVEHPEKGTVGDVDILINVPSQDELERIITFRLNRMFPPGMRDRLHLILEKKGGLSPFTNNFGLFRLKLERIPDAEIQEMMEDIDDPFAEIRLRTKNVEKQKKEAEKALKSDKITPGEFWLMAKPVRGYYPDKAQTTELFLDIYDKHYKYPSLSSKKFDGEHLSVHKIKDKVKVFSEDGKVLHGLLNLKKEVSGLKPEVCVLEVELEKWDYAKKNHYPRETVHTGVKNDNFTANAFDILYYEGEVPDELWEEIQAYDEDKKEWEKKYLEK